MTQDQALDILKTGVNVFLTGEPGSGKTFLVNEYIKYLRKNGITASVTASTGIAATHINGMTIHSWSGIQIKKKLTKADLSSIASNKNIVKRVKNSQVLIIDEVSMLLPEVLTMVNQVCQRIRHTDAAFGGLQVIFVGDFFQLPPIKNFSDSTTQSQNELWDTDQSDLRNVSNFAYDSPAWIIAKPVVCYLYEQHRQEDNEFISILKAIRNGEFNDDHYNLLSSRKCDLSSVPKEVPKLYTHNSSVDELNNQMLEHIKSDVYQFFMSSSGPLVLIKTLTKNCLSPEILSLKIDAVVMFTKNNPKKGFVNGTLGKVVGIEKDTGFPIVELLNNQQIIVERMEWTIDDAGKVLAGVSQIPLRLAWAITVHKSQGMNLDQAVMDLSNVFEYGQGYVALSRVKRLSGLFLLGWNEKTCMVHPEVMIMDQEFRKQSDANTLEYNKRLDKGFLSKQKDFIRSAGGKIEVKVPVKSKKDFSYDNYT